MRKSRIHSGIWRMYGYMDDGMLTFKFIYLHICNEILTLGFAECSF